MTRVFIMGPPRHGTSVVMDVLNQHSATVCFHEIEGVYPTSPAMDALDAEGFWVVQKFPRKFDELHDVARQFPDAKFLLMQQSVKETLAAMERWHSAVTSEHTRIWLEAANSGLHEQWEKRVFGMPGGISRMRVPVSHLHSSPSQLFRSVVDFCDLLWEEPIGRFIGRYVGSGATESTYPLKAQSYR